MDVLKVADGKPKLDGEIFIKKAAMVLDTKIEGAGDRQRSIAKKDNFFLHDGGGWGEVLYSKVKIFVQIGMSLYSGSSEVFVWEIAVQERVNCAEPEPD